MTRSAYNLMNEVASGCSPSVGCDAVRSFAPSVGNGNDDDIELLSFRSEVVSPSSEEDELVFERNGKYCWCLVSVGSGVVQLGNGASPASRNINITTGVSSKVNI